MRSWGWWLWSRCYRSISLRFFSQPNATGASRESHFSSMRRGDGLASRPLNSCGRTTFRTDKSRAAERLAGMLRHITRATASRNAGTLYTQQATGRGKGSRWQSSPLQIYDRWMNIRSRAPLDSAPNDGERGPTPRDKSRLRAHVSRASNELTRLLKLGDPRLTPLKISAATISQIVSGFDDKSGRTRYSLCDLSAAVQVVLDTRWKTARSIGLQASSELGWSWKLDGGSLSEN